MFFALVQHKNNDLPMLLITDV